MYIKEDGILFEGPGLSTPMRVFTPDGWKPYRGNVPKPIGWGEECSEDEALQLIQESRSRKR